MEFTLERTLPNQRESYEALERVLVNMHRSLNVNSLSTSTREKAVCQLQRLIYDPNSTTQDLDALIILGADIVNEENGNMGTALYKAAGNGRVELARHLIRNGADVNRKASIFSGGTPIKNAVYSGNIEMVQLLIEARAKLESGTKNPLIKSAHNNLAMLEFLINHDRNLFAPDEYGNTILHDAAIFTSSLQRNGGNEDENLKVVDFCLRNGFHVDTPDNFKRTPLMKAAENKNTKIISYLLSKEADISLRDYEDDGPLEHAMNNGCVGTLETVKLLVEAGAPVLKKDVELARRGGKRNEGFIDMEVIEYLESKYTGT